MTYGAMSTETISILRASGLEDAWNTEGYETLTVDIVCFGALDESFEIQAGYAEMVVDVLAGVLRGNRDIDDWEVVAYVPQAEQVCYRHSDRT